jgi:ribosomal protein L37AE/L43A
MKSEKKLSVISVKRGRPSNPKKHCCPKCDSSNLRFQVDGDTYHCGACGRKGSKKADTADVKK